MRDLLQAGALPTVATTGPIDFAASFVEHIVAAGGGESQFTGEVVGRLAYGGPPDSGAAVAPPGSTALHLVAGHKGGLTVARLLLEAGADPSMQNGWQQTPSMLAARAGSNQVPAPPAAPPPCHVATSLPLLFLLNA